MNIVVGYIQCDGDLARRAVRVRALAALGCQTVRVEASAAPDRAFKPVLESVCGFLGEGDELVAPDITHLGSSPRAADAFLFRLGARGARLRLLELSAAGADCAPGGRLPLGSGEAPALLPATGRVVDPGTVRALSDHGFGPSQIARKLGVSRMTVWRKLAAANA